MHHQKPYLPPNTLLSSHPNMGYYKIYFIYLKNLWEDESPKVGVSGRSPNSEEQTSDSTDNKSSGKYKQFITSIRKLKYLRTPRILTCPWKGRGPILKTIRHKPRKRRKICYQARRGGMRTKHPSPPYSMLLTHLASCINKEMTLEQCHHGS